MGARGPPSPCGPGEVNSIGRSGHCWEEESRCDRQGEDRSIEMDGADGAHSGNNEAIFIH